MRRIETKRPRKTAFGPLEERLAPHEEGGALAGKRPWQQHHRPGAAPAQQVADVVADDRGCRGDCDYQSDVQFPIAREDAGGEERRLSG